MIGRFSTVPRFSVTLISAAAWFCISNHCALASQLPSAQADAAHAHCADHAVPEKEEPKSNIECCKTLSATASVNAQVILGYKSGDFIPYWHRATKHYDRLVLRPVRSGERDTGPPQALSFAESVLQRSVLAHAPPSLS